MGYPARCAERDCLMRQGAFPTGTVCSVTGAGRARVFEDGHDWFAAISCPERSVEFICSSRAAPTPALRVPEGSIRGAGSDFEGGVWMTKRQQEVEEQARALIAYAEAIELPFTDLKVHPSDGAVLAEWLAARSILRRANLFFEAELNKLYPPEMRRIMRDLRDDAAVKMANLSASDAYGPQQVKRRIRMGTI